MGSKGSADSGGTEVGGIGNDRSTEKEEIVELIGGRGNGGSRGQHDAVERTETSTPNPTQKEPADTGVRSVGDVVEGKWTREGDFIPADGSPILKHDPNPSSATDDDDRGDAAKELSDYVNDLLQKAGKQLGEEGFIFVGGLIPYKRTNSGGWEIDVDKETIRISNINEAQSARVAMGLLAYLIEEMQGDLAKELGVEAIPGLENQVPS